MKEKQVKELFLKLERLTQPQRNKFKKIFGPYHMVPKDKIKIAIAIIDRTLENKDK